MGERWIPVLAAALGLLGGVAGAAVGGYIANQGQEQRFEEERAARIRDLRVDTYVRFLRAVEDEHSNASKMPDSIFLAAGAEVALLAGGDELRQAAAALTDEVVNYDPEQEEDYTEARDSFIELAHSEIEATS